MGGSGNGDLDLSSYERGELLHSSGRSVVFRASTPDSSVVLKLLTVEQATARQIARFRYAFEIGASLDASFAAHPIALTDYGGQLCLVMEDIGGVSLDKRFSGGPPPVELGLRVAILVTRAVSEMHLAGVIHQDIKPANVVMAETAEGLRVQLIDFDLSMRLARERVSPRYPGSMEGTLAFMSPEQTGRTSSAVDGRSDLYSLGATLFWIFSGRVPFDSPDPLALLHAQLASPPPPLTQHAEVPPALAEIVGKLLMKAPSDRYQWPIALLRDLERVLEDVLADRLSEFEVGSGDRAGRLLPFDRVIGRDRELAVLNDAFRLARRESGARLLLVAGYSGIGKSSLVQRLREPVIAAGGRFLSGKCDQLSPAPHGALVDALNRQIEDVISAPREVQEVLSTRLRAEVHTSLPVIVDLLPTLALLVGPQPSPVELPPNESAARLAHAVTSYLSCIGDDHRGTLLFLDDLQWADPASLHLLSRVLDAPETSGLLAVGAYRDNEVEPGHPLHLFVSRVEERHSVERLDLPPLPAESVRTLVSMSLSVEESEIGDLAAVVESRTGGNPFYIQAFLAHLADGGMLTFDANASRWEWDSAAIGAVPVTENVADLVTRRMRTLEAGALQVVQAAACIGDSFRLGLLADALEQNEMDTARQLLPVLTTGLVEPASGDWRLALTHTEERGAAGRVTYRFPHDTVRQGALLSIPTAERGALHLRLGRLLAGDDPTKHLFEVVQQLNAAGDLVEGDERIRLARWNLEAGVRAEEAAAWTRADELFSAGLKRLPAKVDDADVDLAFALTRAAAETAYMTGDHARMEELLQGASKLSITPIDRARLELVRMRAAVDGKRPADAVTAARTALAELGIRIPPNPNLLQVGVGLARCRWMLARLDDVELRALPACKDPRVLAAQEIITEVLGSAYLSEPLVMPILVFEMIQMTVKHGQAPSSGYALCTFGSMVGSRFGAVAEVRRFRDLAIELSRAPEAAEYLGRTLFSVGDFLVHWQGHLREGLPLEEEAWDMCRAQGDLEYAGFAAAAWSFLAWMSGMPLPQLENRTRQFADALEHQGTQQQMVEIFRQLAHNMMDVGNADPLQLSGTTRYDEEKNRAEFTAAGDRTSVASLDLFKCQIACLLGRWPDALLHARAYRPNMDALAGAPHWPWFHFYEALAQARTVDTQRSRRAVLSLLKRNLKKLRNWAEHAPANYGWRADLVAAELARLRGDDLLAIDSYERGIDGARQNGYLPEVALGAELAADHHRERGRPDLAAGLIRTAFRAWAQWGAITKLKQLRLAYPEVAPAALPGASSSSTGVFSLDQVDVLSLLKTTEAIAGEIELSALLQRLTAVVVENGGAEGGAVLLREDDGVLRLRARQRGLTEPVELVSVPLDQTIGLPQSLIRYVARLRRPVVLDDIGASPRFSSDPYFVASGVRSALAAPIERQGKSIGVIYLEKRSKESGFPEHRTEILQLLSGPAAIALENARLYEDVASLSRAHQRFVPQAFLEQLGRGSIQEIALGDQVLRQMTVLFADIRGFTSRSERMEPAAIFAFINDLFGRLVPIIEGRGGFVDKYIGDAIFALFPPGPDAAALAALEMLEAIDERNLHLSDEDSVAIGIGINTGRMMLGTVGTPDRMEATVLSDAVNVASRVEGLTKGYGASLLLTQSAVEDLAEPERFVTRPIGVVSLKGREAPLQVYELRGLANGDGRARGRHFLDGLEAFRRGEFVECILAMEEALREDSGDGPAGWYLRRATELKESGQDPSWSGIIESL